MALTAKYPTACALSVGPHFYIVFIVNNFFRFHFNSQSLRFFTLKKQENFKSRLFFNALFEYILEYLSVSFFHSFIYLFNRFKSHRDRPLRVCGCLFVYYIKVNKKNSITYYFLNKLSLSASTLFNIKLGLNTLLMAYLPTSVIVESSLYYCISNELNSI